jgi:hypothetical protein
MVYESDLSVYNICELALLKVSAFEEESTPRAWLMSTAFKYYNIMIDHMENFIKEQYMKVVTRQSFVASSNVSHGGVAYRCLLSNTSSAATEPGVGSQWEIYWREDDSLTVSALSAWITGTAYTCNADISLAEEEFNLVNAWITLSGDSEQPLRIISSQEYDEIEDKGEKGTPEVLMIEFTSPTVMIGRLWPIPDDTCVDDGVLNKRIRKKEENPSSITVDASKQDNSFKYQVQQLAIDLCDVFNVSDTKWDRMYRELLKIEKEYLPSTKSKVQRRRMNGCYTA